MISNEDRCSLTGLRKRQVSYLDKEGVLVPTPQSRERKPLPRSARLPIRRCGFSQTPSGSRAGTPPDFQVDRNALDDRGEVFQDLVLQRPCSMPKLGHWDGRTPETGLLTG